ncbi:unnamed protein product [Calicophoron daubneyi]|uniref:Centrosomal protein POC5 n=1 Tax=Calicophoron daubneyi TaxID=300641 RepID=A0AAV2T9G7_CALDB
MKIRRSSANDVEGDLEKSLLELLLEYADGSEDDMQNQTEITNVTTEDFKAPKSHHKEEMSLRHECDTSNNGEYAQGDIQSEPVTTDLSEIVPENHLEKVKNGVHAKGHCPIEKDPKPQPLIDYYRLGSDSVDELFTRSTFCSIASTIDEVVDDFREKLNSQYDRVRNQMQSAAKKIVSSEMRRILHTAQQLRDQVIGLRELVRNSEKMIARKDQVIDDLMADLKRVSQNAENTLESYRAKKEQFTISLLGEINSRRLLSRVFSAWKSAVEQTWKQRFMQRLTDEARVECVRITKEYESKVMLLENEVKLAKSELESLRNQKLGENAALRMALMRGVCALNMETMSLFNQSAKSECSESVIPLSNRSSMFAVESGHNDDLERQYREIISELLGRQSGASLSARLIPTPSKPLTHSNSHPPGLPDPSHVQPVDSWPRLQSVGDPKGLATYSASQQMKFEDHVSTDVCSRWLGELASGQALQKHHQRFDASLNGDSLKREYSSSAMKVHNNGNENAIDIGCEDQELEFEEAEAMELPITCPITIGGEQCNELNGKDESSQSSRPGWAFGSRNNCMSAEAARKQLSGRSLSMNKSCGSPIRNLRTSVGSRTHVVQLGAPVGPTSNSSSMMASVHVVRHDPVTRATLAGQVAACSRITESLSRKILRIPLMTNPGGGRHLLRSLLHELKKSYKGQVPFPKAPVVEYVLSEFRYNQVTDAQKCARENEFIHLAETYNTYLINLRKQLELIEKYKSKEKTTEEAAHLVGLELPDKPKAKT